MELVNFGLDGWNKTSQKNLYTEIEMPIILNYRDRNGNNLESASNEVH